MPTLTNILLFALAATIMALTPGPNMIYLISRSMCQGRFAGIISLAGVALGFIFYMLMAAFGLTAIFLAIPYAYEIIKMLGAAYLLWLAWKAISEKSSPLKINRLPHHSLSKLFSMGFFTNILNPKVAIFYMSLFPQFINLNHGSVISQTLFLGFTQITISFIINGMIILTAAMIFNFLNNNAHWAKFQKWLMSLTLSGLAVKLLLTKRPAS
jgi:threonine/homoserine/homoserine lactone efflux protein